MPDHLTSKFDTTVNEVGDIVLPETQAKSATVADSTTVADLTQNPSGIDYLTLAESARGKEQTKNRQEQTSNSAPAPAQSIPGVPEDLTAEWRAVRKEKRAGPISQTVIDALNREAAKAGITPEEAVRCCVERGWQGFRASWHLRDAATPQAGRPANTHKHAAAAATIYEGVWDA